MKRNMLSMKRSTSWFSSSRKYSAMVRPERATRMRDPGGSFIWPNTRAVLLMTPDSCISRHRSFPSRLRSPTPVKTEYPECSVAMFRMSSWMSTVLPTPAPPKRPILPPFAYGAIKSITLMPVSNTLVTGRWSSNPGGARWMGMRLAVGTSPFPSIGSPVTLNMRPRASFPTGTVNAPPVSIASTPRESPSVAERAMHRTRSSPRCRSTSAVILRPPDSMRIAFRISGSLPESNLISMTGPMTCTTFPIFSAMTVPLPVFYRAIR